METHNGQQGTAGQSREAKAKEGEAQTRATYRVLRGGNEGPQWTEELSAIGAASTQPLQLVAPWRARFEHATQGRIWARVVGDHPSCRPITAIGPFSNVFRCRPGAV